MNFFFFFFFPPLQWILSLDLKRVHSVCSIFARYTYRRGYGAADSYSVLFHSVYTTRMCVGPRRTHPGAQAINPRPINR